LQVNIEKDTVVLSTVLFYQMILYQLNQNRILLKIPEYTGNSIPGLMLI